MAVVRWTLFDPITVETYTMQVNPREGGTPNRKKNVQWTNTTAQAGKTLIYEGRDEARTFEWTGVILTEQHLMDLEAWFLKRRQVQLTDDLGRQYWIYIIDYTPTRRRSALHPWKHDYTMRAVEVDWP